MNARSAFSVRKRSLSGDTQRSSFSASKGAELTMHLMKKNRDLARQNSMLLEKCKAMQSKITVLECSDGVVYADRVERLMQCVKPMFEEMEAFKVKIGQVQQVMEAELIDMQSSGCLRKPESGGIRCRLSQTDRELHRQTAAQRLQDNGICELTSITEVSNVSRSRTSSTSVSALAPGPLSLGRLPESLDGIDLDVFGDCGDLDGEPLDPCNMSFLLVESDNQHAKPAAEQLAMTGAAGDQVASSRQASTPVPVAQAGADEISDLKEWESEAKGAGKRRPRDKKRQKPLAPAASGDGTAAAQLPSPPPPTATATAAENVAPKLRPRRKLVNYSDGASAKETGNAAAARKKAAKKAKSVLPPSAE